MYSALTGACSQIIEERIPKDKEEFEPIEREVRKIGDVAKKEIKVKATLSPGYEKRFTTACLEIIKKREARREGASA